MDVEIAAQVSTITQPPKTQSSHFGSLKLWCGHVLSASVILWLTILLIAFIGAIPLSQLIVGILFKDQCPMNYFIAIYLIVAGVIGLAYVTISIHQVSSLYF